MKRLLIAFVATILMLSVSGIAEQNTSDAKVTIDPKYIGVDKKFNRPVMIINITTDTPGNMAYIERYYLRDSSGNLKLNKTVKYNESFVNEKLMLRIIRPNAVPGKQYAIVKGTVALNNKTYSKWLNITTKAKSTVKSTNTVTPNQGESAKKESPGFQVIGLAMAISMIYFLKKRR